MNMDASGLIFSPLLLLLRTRELFGFTVNAQMSLCKWQTGSEAEQSIKSSLKPVPA